jgi:predicted TIM-barrel fold metal-dependent hydrolase
MQRLIDCDAVAGFWPRANIDMSPARTADLLSGHGITDACVVSARGILFDHCAGNREALRWAELSLDWAVRFIPVGTVDLRRYIGYKEEIREMSRSGIRLWRLFPEYQGWDFDHPGFRRIVSAIEDEGGVLFVKGKPGKIVKPISGSRITLIIGTHYYDAAEALALWEEGADFRLSTQLLHGPGTIKLIAETAGEDKLVFGTGTPWSAPGSAPMVADASGLSDDALRKLRFGNLSALIGGG